MSTIGEPTAVRTELGVVTNTTPASNAHGLTVRPVGATPAGTSTIGGTLDAGPSWTSVWGVAGVPYTSADRSASVASVTDAPTTGQKLCIDDILFSTDTALNVTFKEETSGTVMFGPWYLAANTTIQVTLRGKKKLATADKKLQVQTSAAGNIAVQVGYHSEA